MQTEIRKNVVSYIFEAAYLNIKREICASELSTACRIFLTPLWPNRTVSALGVESHLT